MSRFSLERCGSKGSEDVPSPFPSAHWTGSDYQSAPSTFTMIIMMATAVVLLASLVILMIEHPH
jgi:hypothetical protein